MGFSLSSRSRGKLEGVHPDMVAVENVQLNTQK